MFQKVFADEKFAHSMWPLMNEISTKEFKQNPDLVYIII